jgi:DNA-binding transcriptional LysR family regulator
MDKAPLDWSLIRSLLAVADTGSLSGAARMLNISQPTLGRHVREAEAQLGLSLFTRVAKGLSLTPEGAALLPAAREMQAAAARLSRMAAGASHDLAGTVRITASAVVSAHILPPLLAEFRQAEPLIQIELVATDKSENLLFGAADLALRMYRPTQPDIIAQEVTRLPMALYAARRYLARAGVPASRKALMQLDFVGFDTSDLIRNFMSGAGETVPREFFGLRCDDQQVYWQLVRAGCGIGGMQCCVGDADPLVARLDGLIDLPALPLWLAAAPELRQSPRLRRVWDFLANRLGKPGKA